MQQCSVESDITIKRVSSLNLHWSFQSVQEMKDHARKKQMGLHEDNTKIIFFHLNYKTNQHRLLNEKYFIVFSTLCSLQLYKELTIWLPDFLIIVILSHHLTAFFCNTTLGSKPDYSSAFSTDTHLHMLFTELNRKTDNKLCVSFCSYHKPLSRIGRLHLLTKTHKHIQCRMQ